MKELVFPLCYTRILTGKEKVYITLYKTLVMSWYPGYFFDQIRTAVYRRPRVFYNLTEGESNYLAGIASFLGVKPEDLKATKGERWVEGLEAAYLKPGVKPPPLPDQEEVARHAQEKYEIEHPERTQEMAEEPMVTGKGQPLQLNPPIQRQRGYHVESVIPYEVNGRRMWFVQNRRLF